MIDLRRAGSEPTLMDLSVPGRRGYLPFDADVPELAVKDVIPESHLRNQPPSLPELSEVGVVRHFHRLSHRNFNVDYNMYPLGSCTMKYNPKVNEDLAALPGFRELHPLQPPQTCQGILGLMYELAEMLAEITGLDAVTLQPSAGAQGELAGMLMVRAYHRARGKDRHVVLIPDSAHGTNPASLVLAGFRPSQVRSLPNGEVDLDHLRELLSEDVAALMITNPNTLGIFETEIENIAALLHDAGALLYMDGANMNALLGIARPGDFGVDICHLNLHKTFSTPHGGGGPGAGPVAVTAELEPYLPIPRVELRDGGYALVEDAPHSIGRMHAFHGNVGVLVKAYAYLRALGARGLRRVAENAIINANYLATILKEHYQLPHDRVCQHEFVLSALRQKQHGVRAGDVAKRLLDYGFHAPTVYFPLIVEEALMVEPTETEGKDTLDAFAEAMIAIARESEEQPELVRNAPHHTPVSRVAEAAAAREMNVCQQMESLEPIPSQGK